MYDNRARVQTFQARKFKHVRFSQVTSFCDECIPSGALCGWSLGSSLPRQVYTTTTYPNEDDPAKSSLIGLAVVGCIFKRTLEPLIGDNWGLDIVAAGRHLAGSSRSVPACGLGTYGSLGTTTSTESVKRLFAENFNFMSVRLGIVLDCVLR